MKGCRFCECKELWKAGIVNGKQRYKCKQCGKNQAEVDSRRKYSDEAKTVFEGCGFKRIARIISELFEKKNNIDIKLYLIGSKSLEQKL